MRDFKVVVSALVLAIAVGGTAFAADTAATSKANTQTTVSHQAASPAKNKAVAQKKAISRKAANSSAPAATTH